MNSDTYVLGRGEAETRRLILQHQIYGPITRRFLSAAGIGTGMKVLDVGSGAGDVALLLAELVGPTGRVVGLDLDNDVVETARARVASAGWGNVTFLCGDALQTPLDRDFDAVTGRWFLMYQPRPAELVRHLASRLVPGGIVAFQENDFTYPPSVLPPTELSRQIQKWSVPPPGGPGPDTRMGSRLFRVFLEAGLPSPQLHVEAPVGGGPDWPGYDYVAATLRNLLPALQQGMGIDPAEVDIDTLAARMRDDVLTRQAVQMLPIIFGAWARKSAAGR